MSIIQQLFRRSEGNILIMTAIALPVLLTAVGFSVDINRFMNYRGYVQSATDQAAIAAVAVDGQNRDEIARRFVNASMPTQNGDFTIKKIVVDAPAPGDPIPASGLAVTVTTTVTLKNAFGRFIGMPETEITRTSTVERNVENVEAIITMASSGTMCSTKTRTTNANSTVPGDTLIGLTPDPTCAHFNALRNGVKEFIDILEDNQTVNNFAVGLVPYNYKVRMPNPNRIPPSLTALEDEPLFFENMNRAAPLSPIQPLTTDLGAVDRALDGMRQSEMGRAWSRSDLATHIAGLMLSPDSTNFFPGGDNPKPFGHHDTRKVVILMTDGINIGCCFTNWPTGDFTGQYVYLYKPYNTAQIDICNTLKQNNVTIFSVLLDVELGDPGGAEMDNTFARCATGTSGDGGDNDSTRCTDKQFCFHAKDDEQLVQIYQQIAQTFYKPHITH